MSKACAAYQEKYSKIPKDAATLVAFSKKTKGIKEISEALAKKAITAAKKAAAEAEAEAAAAAAAAAAAKSKGGKKKKKKKGSPPPEPEPEPEPEPVIKKKKKEKVSSKYSLGDDLLLSKDRMGTLRYAGEIPELGPGIWYGVELTDGSVGQTNGSVKGTSYFHCKDGLKRALFVPLMKIRRKMNTRDHVRQKSLTTMQAVNKGVLAADSKEAEEEADKEAASKEEAVEEEPDEEDDAPAEEEAPEADEEEEEEEEVPKATGRRGSVVKPTKGGFQSILQFILDQPGSTRDEFLDIYTNPALNPLFTEAFKQIKDMDPDKQSGVWTLLLGRWKRYLK